jgi:type IV pilus assembly protein PilW
MKPHNSHSPSPQAGFTLVEIMVGLVIGMLATAIILQVMSNFEAQKRVTTGTADAQTNGAIALYNVGRELQQAGYPLMPLTNSSLECTTLTYGTTGITSISPISITNGTSDSITMRYGDSLSGGAFTEVMTAAGNDLTVVNNLACKTGDISLIINGSTCALSTASAVPAVGATGSAVQRTLTLKDAISPGTSATLSCLGRWNEVTYSVSNGNLLRNGVATMEGVVNVQAQYGISASPTSNQVTQWVDATNSAAGNWLAPSVTDRNRIKAVRIAVVARNAKQEAKDPATNACVTTTACSSTTTANPTGLCAWEGSTASPAPAIDLSADPNWGCYRYRVFESIVPLRNVIWSKSTL